MALPQAVGTAWRALQQLPPLEDYPVLRQQREHVYLLTSRRRRVHDELRLLVEGLERGQPLDYSSLAADVLEELALHGSHDEDVGCDYLLREEVREAVVTRTDYRRGRRRRRPMSAGVGGQRGLVIDRRRVTGPLAAVHMCTYIHSVGFQWDAVKARANLRKHGVDFADAVGVFDDPLALTARDSALTEDRMLSLGRDVLGRVIVVNWTWRDRDIRLISARRATPRERRRYQEGYDDA